MRESMPERWSSEKPATKVIASGEGSASAAAAAGGAACTKSTASAAEFAKIEANEGKTLVLTGDALCELCDLEWSETCNTAFKTADGKVYRLIKNEATQKLRKAEAEKGFEITTRVVEVDGEKYLELENFKAL